MKTLVNISILDLETHPVWSFDLANELDGEACPVDDFTNVQSLGKSIAVRTSFFCKDGRSFLGYITWFKSGLIMKTQPVIFCHDRKLSFYFGLGKPSHDEIEEFRLALGGGAFPINYASEAIAIFSSHQGVLEGLYYIDEDDKVGFVPVP